MLRGEREYDLLHLFFAAASRALEGHTRSVQRGRVEAAPSGTVWFREVCRRDVVYTFSNTTAY